MTGQNPQDAAAATGQQELGSLAQSTRESELNKTKWILVAIGLLTLGVNAFMLSNATNEMKELNLVEPDYSRVLGLVRMIYGGAAFLGLVFIICGLLVKKFPVPLTILSLILYIGAMVGFGFLDPATLMQGLLMKIIIIVALGKSVQTALAYQSERAMA